MRILVVEDEADLNLLLRKVLTKAGYTVTAAGTERRPSSTCWVRSTTPSSWT